MKNDRFEPVPRREMAGSACLGEPKAGNVKFFLDIGVRQGYPPRFDSERLPYRGCNVSAPGPVH
jgi:hypothetical protein